MSEPTRDMFLDPPREFSVMPLWFWNDELREDELARQIADFEAHGVYGFIIHPRVGLPRSIGWMSERFLHFVRFAVDEAKRRGMYVILYDEGMYPSGSSAGQVVAENPAYHVRCLDRVELRIGETPPLGTDQNLVAILPRAGGGRVAIFDRRCDGYIRGVHYLDATEASPQHFKPGDPPEDQPPAGDILNPDAVGCFIRLVYDGYARAVGDHFGKTILAIFTDEPGPMGKTWGRPDAKRVRPGNATILPHVNRLLGYDFTPHLPALWFDDEPDAARRRADWNRAIAMRLEEAFYAPIHRWCEEHRLPLCGHPRESDDIGALRFFQIPGQDAIARTLLPGTPSALEGAVSTQAKCASSAMIHLRRRRCGDEFLGAYGHELTYDEMKWLTDWLLVRGINFLWPHAFYYSYRGRRRDERPPDVGPNSPWWDRYKRYADYSRRLCWLNTDSTHVCHVAILAEANHLPWRAAKELFQNQIDFNYVEMRHLWEDASVNADGLRLAGMCYQVLIVDGEMEIPPRAQPAIDTLRAAGRLITSPAEDVERLLTRIADAGFSRDVTLRPPHPDVRYRHVIKAGRDYYILCNEGMTPVTCEIDVSAIGEREWVDPMAAAVSPIVGPARLSLAPYALTVLRVSTLTGTG